MTPDLEHAKPGIDELSKTVALMRLMKATGDTVHLTGPALAAVLAELDRRGAIEQRAQQLASTDGLGGAARTYQHAGCFVLGVTADPADHVRIHSIEVTA